jgi:nucleotide-binding universal stress UspA family protein
VPGEATPTAHALLAYDGSPKADEALFISAHLANCWNVTLTVMTVTEIGRRTSEALSLAKSYLRKHDVQATFCEIPKADYGSVGAVVLAAAQEHRCDHIIMGGYGRKPMLEIVLGSSVDHVLRESPVPVLICR